MNRLTYAEANPTVASYIEDHNCIYAHRILEVDRLQKMGSYGMSLCQSSHFATRLTLLHENNACPPTHVGTGPTEAWADWVDTTRV